MGAEHDTLLPVRWTSPEAIMFGQYTSASDVWSFGVTTWEVFTFGARPYESLSDIEVVKALTQFQTLQPPSNCPEKIREVLEKCFSKLTTQRPSFAELESQLEAYFQATLSELNAVVSTATLDGISIEYPAEPVASII